MTTTERPLTIPPAEPEDPEAQNSLGLSYAGGVGVRQNHQEALVWFQKSALQGDADALYHLGLADEYGLGVDKDQTIAVEYYQRAAQNHHDRAH